MFRQCARMIVWIALVALVGGCGKAEPTATPVPSVNSLVSPTAPPAATPVPPAETPLGPTAESPPAAAPTVEPGTRGDIWFKTYGGNRNDVANDILLADDGGFFIVGVTDLEFEPEQRGDVYLIKTNAAGDILWERTYGGQGYEAGATAFQTSDGALLISGATNSLGAGGMDIYLIKVDQDGNELWSRTFGGPLDEVGAAWPLDDGGYMVGGNIVAPSDPVVDDPGVAGYAGFAGRSSVYLARIDSDGKELWARTFGGENNVLASSALQTPDGGFIILATIMYFPDNDDDIYLLKVDENGKEVWSRTWESGMSSGYDLVRAADGNYLITGPYSSPDDMDRSKRDFLFIKVDPEGNEIWTSTFGDPEIIDYGQVLAATTDGGYVAAGGAMSDLTTWDEDIVIVKVDESGQLLWEQIVETDTHSMFGTMLQHPDGGYVVAGSIFNDGNFDIFVIKTDAQGNVTATSEPATAAPGPGTEQAVISPETARQITSLQTLEGHGIGVPSVAFSPDDTLLASIGFDGVIKLWDVESGESVRTISTGHRNFAATVAFAPDGALLASGGEDGAKVWDVESGEMVRSFEGISVLAVTFSPDSALLAAGCARTGTTKLWDVASGQEVYTLDNQNASTQDVAFAPDGALLATGHSRDFALNLWDVERGQLARTLSGHSSDVHKVAFSPDGALLASASASGVVRLWDVESGRELRAVRRPGSPLFAMTFSPDGALLASGSGDSRIELWEVESGRALHTLRGHSDQLTDLAFSSDGSLLASCSYDGNVILWGAPADTPAPLTATEMSVATVTPTPPKPTATPETSPISSGGVIAFTSYGDDQVGSIYVMDVGAILQGAGDSEPQMLIENASSGVWSPDGARMAYMSQEDGRDALYVLDLDSGETLELTDAARLYPSSWSPDGNRIAFCAKEGGEWDIYAINSDGSDVQQLTDHPAEDISPAWSPDGTQIAFCSMRAGNPEVFVMNSDGSNPRNLTQSDAIDNAPNWSPDGAQIVFHSDLAGNSDIYVMDSDGSALRQLTVNSTEDWRPDWSPDGNWISFLSYRNPDGDSEVYVLDLSGGTEAEGNRPRRLTHSPAHDENPTWRPAAPAQGPEAISLDTVDKIELLHTIEGHDGRIYGLDFSSDGALLASGSYDGTIRLWEVGSWQEKGILNQRGEWTVFFAPDDAHIATEDGTIWDIVSGEKVQSPDARQSHVTFSPDGRWMASAGYNSPIEVWDVETRQVVQTLEGHTDRVFGLAFSPDGTLLASGSGLGPSDVSDYVVKVWDVANGAEVHALKGHSGDIHAVAFSPDGTLVASASIDYTVRLWDVQSGELVHTLRHRDGLYDVTFSPDGSLLASAGCDRTVKLWDVASGKLLHSLRHGDEVMAVVFAPDGTLLASGGYDNQVYLWGIPR